MYSSKIKIRSNWVDSKENIQVNNKNIVNNIVSVKNRRTKELRANY